MRVNSRHSSLLEVFNFRHGQHAFSALAVNAVKSLLLLLLLLLHDLYSANFEDRVRGAGAGVARWKT